MRIAIGSDHAGCRLREAIRSCLLDSGLAGGRHQRRVDKIVALEASYPDAPR